MKVKRYPCGYGNPNDLVIDGKLRERLPLKLVACRCVIEGGKEK